jgi:hypothetical protein
MLAPGVTVSAGVALRSSAKSGNAMVLTTAFVVAGDV